MARDELLKFVEKSVVANKFVVVADVPVAFTKVKFWRVDEPFNRRFERFVRPPVAVRVPVKLAALVMVCPFMSPEVTTPRFELVA